MTAAAASENPFAGQGVVLLDIGGEVGALVVTMPAGMEGVEVEIRPVTAHEHGIDDALQGDGHGSRLGRRHVHHAHVAVVNRPVGDALVPSLVFPDLVEGRYELAEKDTVGVGMIVDVVGGEVTTAEWVN